MTNPAPDSLPTLSPEEIQRFGRHLTLPDVGLQGQRLLKSSRVLVLGAGGLGAPILTYLAAAGVGRIGVVDDDRVELSNLQRQVIYADQDLGQLKAELASARMRAINPHASVETHALRFDAANALDLLSRYDLVIDGTDNFPTRYLANDACVLANKPLIYGSIFRFEGQVSLFDAQNGPCYRCLYPQPPRAGSVPNCAEGGVLGVLPGVIGSLQATEAIKLILGKGRPLRGRLLLYDALSAEFRELRLTKDPDCPICGNSPTITSLTSISQQCSPQTERNSPMFRRPVPQISVTDLNARLSAEEDELQLLDVRTDQEWQIGHINGAKLLPVQELQQRIGELDRSQEWAVYCHVGGRSSQAVAYLMSQGFERVHNVTGGIDSWSLEIDPTIPRY